MEQTDADPVILVDRNDAIAFCKGLGKKHGVSITLPTEAQWEYACRAGTQTQFSYGDDPDYSRLGGYAWEPGNADRKTHPVGKKKPNPWELYDMHGNVREWCLYGYRKYSSGPHTDPRGRESRFGVNRGGSWLNGKYFLRSAQRRSADASHSYNYLGFRVMVELPSRAAEPDIMSEKPAYPGFFPIGAWSIWFGAGRTQQQIQAKTERAREVLQQMKTFGINTPFSTNLYAGDGEPRLAMLAKELGMHVISYNTRLRTVYKSKKPVNVSEVQKIVAEDAQRLKACPNLFEYFVWADPPQPHFKPDMWKTMAQACMETDPTRPPQFTYSNAQAARPYWEASSLPSIHHYIHPFRAETPTTEAIDTQIKHLKSFSQLAPDASRIAWIQTFGDGKRYRAPTGAEMRCLASLALAHGAKGLVYYAWGSTKYDGLVTRDGQPTERAHEAKRLGQVIDKIGPILLRLRLGPDLTKAEGNALATTLVSKGGVQYAFVVNLDVANQADVNVTVSKTTTGAPSGVRDVLDGKEVAANVSAGKLSFVARLEPGEGKLFRILRGKAGAASATREFAYGYFLVSKPVHEDFDRHMSLLAPYTNTAVVYKGETMDAVASKGIKALLIDGASYLRRGDERRFKEKVGPIWKKYREHILAIYLVDEPYAGGKMTRDELETLVARCKRVLPDLPVYVSFGLGESRPFWKQEDPVPEGVDMVGFNDFVEGTPMQVRSRISSDIKHMKRVSKDKPVLVVGRAVVGDKRLTSPLTDAEALAYKEAVVEAGAAGLLWAFYDETGWGNCKGASSFPAILSAHREIAEELGVRISGAARPQPTQRTSPKPVRRLVIKDAGAGGYEAFPRVIRLSNGDLLMAFYAGYVHMSFKRSSLPKGGRIVCIRSGDNGRTWSKPTVVADTPGDDRNGVLIETQNGAVLCHFMTRSGPKELPQLEMAVSRDYGKRWEPATGWISARFKAAATGASAVKLSDGTLVLPVYVAKPGRKVSIYDTPALLRSRDGGKKWGDRTIIDNTGQHPHYEPALAPLPDGRLLCVMRPCMCKSYSTNGGRTWTKPERIGFRGDAPCLLRTSAGILLCAHRHPGTSLHYSLDDGATWKGPITIDAGKGAYPSMVELPDGTIFCAYYDGTRKSDIWSVRFKATAQGITWLRN